jgi:hypothetical protein
MNGRVLLAAVATLVLLLVVVLTGTAFSGEHPWDSDRSDGGKSPSTSLSVDTLVVRIDSVSAVGVTSSTSAPLPWWSTIVRTTWAVVMTK